MQDKLVDARGLACPQPVVLTRTALLEPGALTVRVLVDNPVAIENVRRMATSQGWDISEQSGQGNDVELVLRRGGVDEPVPGRSAARPADRRSSTVVLLTSEVFGAGDDRLGRILMRSFIKTLKDLEPLPGMVILANAGVRLSTEGSDLLDDLLALEAAGVEIVSCGTCLDYYGLVDALRVGTATNMYDIVTSLAAADRIVRP